MLLLALGLLGLLSAFRASLALVAVGFLAALVQLAVLRWVREPLEGRQPQIFAFLPPQGASGPLAGNATQRNAS